MSLLETMPAADECAEYYRRYIDRVPAGNILSLLEKQRDGFADFVRGIPGAKENHRYGEGKWTVKEAVGHVVDCERVFIFRAFAFARGDQARFPGFEQDEYVERGNFAARTLADLAEEFFHQRSSCLVLYRSFDDATWMRRGNASGFEFTAHAIPFIMAGHVIHHQDVLKERYL